MNEVALGLGRGMGSVVDTVVLNYSWDVVRTEVVG